MDPVKAILSTWGWLVRAAPAVGPYPGMTFTTPGGKPASFTNAAIASAVSGVCSAGLMTRVHPSSRESIYTVVPFLSIHIYFSI